ncbi:NAD-dependent epimerase/dehydratase family protein [Rhizobium azibense]|nr:NAD-dependent epimerase/dehydratase family protein [Rhizobium azibense]
MSKNSAIIIGGTGQIGRACAQSLLDQGWTVSITHRGNNALPSYSLIKVVGRLFMLELREYPALPRETLFTTPGEIDHELCVSLGNSR